MEMVKDKIGKTRTLSCFLPVSRNFDFRSLFGNESFSSLKRTLPMLLLYENCNVIKPTYGFNVAKHNNSNAHNANLSVHHEHPLLIVDTKCLPRIT